MNSNKPRQEATIPIGGLDTSTPDELAPNGTCATLHNLRYVDNAWHGVGPLTPLAEIPFGSTTEGSTTTTSFVKILYKHPASPDNKYIAFIKNKVTTERGGGGSSRMELVGYAEVDITAQRPNPDGTLTTITDTVAIAQQAVLLDGLDANTDYTFTHFGKVLIAQGRGKAHYFVYKEDGYYRRFAYPEPVTIYDNVGDGNASIDYINGERSTSTAVYYEEHSIVQYLCWKLYDCDNNTPLISTNNGTTDHWSGEICYLVAFRMKDGTILSPSELRILCSERMSDKEDVDDTGKQIEFQYVDKIKETISGATSTYVGLIHKRTSDEASTTKTFYTKRLSKILPTIDIRIPQNIDTQQIDRVAIFATRINSIFDYLLFASTTMRQSFHSTSESYFIEDGKYRTPYKEAYSNNKLPEQPLYLVAEKRIDDIENNQWLFTMGYGVLKDIETRSSTIFEPTQSLHSISAKCLYEYNNRLHLGDIQTTYFKGYDLVQYNYQLSASVELNNSIIVRREQSENSTKNYLYLPSRIISYPDAQANKYNIEIIDKSLGIDGEGSINTIMLESSLANNYAYYIPSPKDYIKYPTFYDEGNYTIVQNLPHKKETLSEPNRLQVSKAGNCFALPFDTSYNIGNEDTHILALGTTAEMLADSRFGETPLYVFTNEAVWAAIQGQGEVLYSNWAFINPDRIINSSTAVANGFLFYITARGIHAISGRQAKLISTPIDDEGGQSPDFSSAEMWVQHLNNELVIYRGHNADDFVYNIDNGYWSTRTNCGRKIAQKQTVKETLWIDANYPTTGGSTQYIRIYDCEHEVNETVKASVTTRPIKLQRGAIARIENIITRLSGVARITIEIKGSNNLVDWATLRNVTFSPAERSVTIRHLPASAVYHVITLSADITLRKSITLFDITFYTKYLHKMR